MCRFELGNELGTSEAAVDITSTLDQFELISPRSGHGLLRPQSKKLIRQRVALQRGANNYSP